MVAAPLCPGPGGCFVVAEYARHKPEKTLLDEVIRAELVDRVLPEVSIRQWVLRLPYPLRFRCAWNARLTSEVLRAFLRSVFTDQRRRARKLFGIRKGQCGSVTFVQRFGSALNLTPHFHTLVLDGVYPGPSHDHGHFVVLPPPETEDVARVLAGTARRILRKPCRALPGRPPPA